MADVSDINIEFSSENNNGKAMPDSKQKNDNKALLSEQFTENENSEQYREDSRLIQSVQSIPDEAIYIPPGIEQTGAGCSNVVLETRVVSSSPETNTNNTVVQKEPQITSPTTSQGLLKGTRTMPLSERHLKFQFSQKLKNTKENIEKLKEDKISSANAYQGKIKSIKAKSSGKNIRSVHESSIPGTKIDLQRRPIKIEKGINTLSTSSSLSDNTESNTSTKDVINKDDKEIFRETHRSRAHLSHNRLDPVHQQKHIELRNATDNAKMRQPKCKKLLSAARDKFENMLEKCINEIHIAKTKTKHSRSRSKDDHAILHRKNGIVMHTLNLSVLSHEKKLSRSQCLDVLLRAFSKDANDVIISCTKVINLL